MAEGEQKAAGEEPRHDNGTTTNNTRYQWLKSLEVDFGTSPDFGLGISHALTRADFPKSRRPQVNVERRSSLCAVTSKVEA